MFGDRQGRGFGITQLRAVTSLPAISAIGDISLVLGEIILLTQEHSRGEY